MKILITGGHGMVGKSLQKLIKKTEENKFIFLSSKDCDLRNIEECKIVFQRYQPDYIIHLAANVGGLYKNINNNAGMMVDNMKINENVLEMCDKFNVDKGIFCLSSCVYPHSPKCYPMTEDMIHDGPPHPSNEGYGYSKRFLEIQCRNYNKSGKKYMCVSPVNLYGENDNFSLENGHVVASLIRKFYIAKYTNTPVFVCGDGTPLRQFVFVDDFAKIIIELIDNDNVTLINIANDEITINDLVEILKKIFNYHDVIYDTSKSNGCLKKTVSNEYFSKIFTDFKFTHIYEGILRTVNWFCKNVAQIYNHIELNEIVKCDKNDDYFVKKMELNEGDYLISLDIEHENTTSCELYLSINGKKIKSIQKIDHYNYYNEISTTHKYNIQVSIIDATDNAMLFVNIENKCKTDFVKIKNIYLKDMCDKFSCELLTNDFLHENTDETFCYPLTEDLFQEDDIECAIKVIKSKKMTMGNHVDEFEKMFSKFIGSKYAVFVNSGSSANLLALATVTNFLRPNKIEKYSEVLVPVVCWSTSVFPIYQMNLVPVFVDVDPLTLNMDLNDMEKKITSNTRAIMAVHILGNCTNMSKLIEIAKKYNLEIIEDTCESLGSKYDGKYLGTFGSMGTYSFYYSHHITTIEGGMIVCNDDKDYEILKCLRSHGWIRHLENKDEYINKYKNIDPRYLFINLGYNLRSTDLNASIGISQLKKIDIFNGNRKYNFNKIKQELLTHSKYNDQFYIPTDIDNGDIVWFALCLILKEKYENNYFEYINYLTNNNIENRPVVTGNILKQPVIQYLSNTQDPNEFTGGNIIHNRGIYIGIPSVRKMGENEIKKLSNVLFCYFD